MMINISAAICNYNAGNYLPDVIDSVMNQDLDQDSYETILIDNNSSDNSFQVIEQLQRGYRNRLRVFSESRPGLVHARNKAMQVARTPIVAFIDADALADPGWLRYLLQEFESSEQAGVVGGTVLVKWDHSPPEWWNDRLAEVLNYFRPSEDSEILSYPRYPYGTNFAIRTEAVKQVGPFAAALGRRGRELRAGEEGELCLRLEKAGWQIRYTPNAVVHHRTQAARLTRRFIVRRAFCHGRSQYLLEKLNGFESGLYLSWPEILWSMLAALCGLRWDLPYTKYILFRVGYHYQRVFARQPP